MPPTLQDLLASLAESSATILDSTCPEVLSFLQEGSSSGKVSFSHWEKWLLRQLQPSFLLELLERTGPPLPANLASNTWVILCFYLPCFESSQTSPKTWCSWKLLKPLQHPATNYSCEVTHSPGHWLEMARSKCFNS